jgi:hypothetical protein
VDIDVSKEYAASIFRIEHISLYRHVTTMVVVKQRDNGYSLFEILNPSDFKVYAEQSSETVVFAPKTIR